MYLWALIAAGLLVTTLPWVKVAPDGRSAEVFVEITSGDPASLVGVSTPAASSATLLAPGKARKPAKEIALAGGTRTALAPGKHRIALDALKRPLKLGDRVPVTLTIQSADGARQDVGFNAEVRKRSALEDELKAHKH